MRAVVWTTSFKKDYKLAKKRNLEIDKLKNFVRLLANDKPIPPYARSHKLVGNYRGLWECHIEPDWLLIYELVDDDLLVLRRTGSHADLFK